MNKWTAAFLILTTVSSCAVGPNFHRPCTPEKRGWIDGDNDKLQSDRQADVHWWTLFNDPALDSLIETAVSQNLPLQTACYRILEAKARLGVAVGQFFPQTQEAVGSATRVKISENAPNTGPAPDNYFWDYNLGLQAAWELDFWGKFRRGIESADAIVKAAYADYDNILVILLSEVASTYIRIRTIQEQMAIVQNNIKLQERSVEITSAQFEGGFVTELDVQQAKVLLTDTQARMPELEIQLRQAENGLSVLLGIPPEDLTPCIGIEKIPRAPLDAVVGIPADLLCRRPDIRRSLYEAAAQSARVGIAYADFFPQVSFTGFLGFQSGGNVVNNVNMGGGSLFARDSLAFNYGPSFAWPILNYGRIYNNVRAERALLCQLVTNYQNRVLEAYREAEDGIITFIKAQQQELYLQESVDAAERAVDLANTQYVEGLADYTRVLNTQQALLTAQERHTLSKGDISLGLIAAYRALGGGWEIRCCD